MSGNYQVNQEAHIFIQAHQAVLKLAKNMFTPTTLPMLSVQNIFLVPNYLLVAYQQMLIIKPYKSFRGSQESVVLQRHFKLKRRGELIRRSLDLVGRNQIYVAVKMKLSSPSASCPIEPGWMWASFSCSGTKHIISPNTAGTALMTWVESEEGARRGDGGPAELAR